MKHKMEKHRQKKFDSYKVLTDRLQAIGDVKTMFITCAGTLIFNQKYIVIEIDLENMDIFYYENSRDIVMAGRIRAEVENILKIYKQEIKL